jgi:putative ABC transport system substrate-binding protein
MLASIARLGNRVGAEECDALRDPCRANGLELLGPFRGRRRFLAAGAMLLAPCRVLADEGPTVQPVRITFVGSVSAASAPRAIAAFWSHLRTLGWAEGKNVIADARWADGHPEKLPGIMAQVVAQRVDLIVTYGTPAASAARGATRTLPIVVMAMGDPVGTGVVESLARPGGNVTGLSAGWDEGFAGKWLELLQECIPRLTTIAVMGHASNPLGIKVTRAIESLAPSRGLKIRVLGLNTAEDIAPAIREARSSAQALMVLSDPITFTAKRQIVQQATRQGLPTMFPLREFVDDGGLIAYGTDTAAMGRRAAEYVNRILRGAKPGDLPIEQPTQFTLVVNQRTAKALQLRLPESILLRADEVIR